MLTPKETGGGRSIFPYAIKYSAILEAGFSSTGAMSDSATIAFGYKPTKPNSAKPLCDVTGHYLMTIKKVGNAVNVWKNNVLLNAYTGAVGSTYAELVANVLTFYSGSSCGYYSSLRIVEESLDYTAFWELSDLVTGLWVPKDVEGLSLSTHLDFVDGNSSAINSVEEGWISGDIGVNSVSTNYTVFDQAVEIPAGTTVTALKVWTDGGRATSNARVGIYRQTGTGEGKLVALQSLTIGSSVGFSAATLDIPFIIPSDGYAYRMCIHSDRCVSCTTASGQGGDKAGNLLTGIGASLAWTDTSWRAPIMRYVGTAPAGLGTDVSGSKKHWILKNALQTTDTPTNNYCVLNPLSSLDNGTVQYAHGNLVRSCSIAAGEEWSTGTFILPKTGKWAWRVYTTAVSALHAFSGIMKAGGSSDRMIGLTNDSWGGSVADSTSLPSVGIVMYDADLRELKITKNGSHVNIWNNGQSLGCVASLPEGDYVPVFGKYNRGDTLWSYVSFGSENPSWLPEGHKTLCTANIPNPVVYRSSSAADIVLRTGYGDNAGFHLVDPSAGTILASGWDYYSSNEAAPVCFDGNTEGQSGIREERLSSYLTERWVGKNWGEAVTVTRSVAYGSVPLSICQSGFLTMSLQGSNDGVSWAVLDSKIVSAGTMKVVMNYTGGEAYSQHRFHLTSGGETVQLCEVQFFTGEVGDTYIRGLEFQPDFVNIKSRSKLDRDWNCYDSVRGATKKLETNTSDSQAGSVEYLKSFDVDGYSLGKGIYVNEANQSYLDMCLKAGPECGFAVDTFVKTVGEPLVFNHSFGKPVAFAIVKNSDINNLWTIYSTHLGLRQCLYFTTGKVVACTWLNNSETFGGLPGGAAGKYVAYMFTDSDIFKAFSYIGNGVADGPFVNLGGKMLSVPFLKNSNSSTTHWQNFDAVRSNTNPINAGLVPSNDNAEWIDDVVQATSQGFKVVHPDAWINGDTNKIVGLAILESTKYSNAF